MKKSRIAKLSLMGASIAALAATLTTSTYAWYISNKTASADEVTGSTAGAGADQSILLSKTGNYGDFSTSISFTNPTNGLVPVYSANGTTFSDVNGTSVVPTTISSSNTGTGGVYHFSFYVLSVGGGTYDPTITIQNTGNYTAQPCYAAGLVTLKTATTTATATVGQQFYVNALSAMNLSFQSTPSTVLYGSDNYSTAGASGFNAGTPSDVYANSLGTNNATTLYSVSDYIKTQNTTATTTPYATAGAYNYYTELNGTAQGHKEDSYGDTGNTATAIGQLSLTANTPVKLDYYLWLDGTADTCFNACANQTIKVSFSYTAH